MTKACMVKGKGKVVLSKMVCRSCAESHGCKWDGRLERFWKDGFMADCIVWRKGEQIMAMPAFIDRQPPPHCGYTVEHIMDMEGKR